MFQKDNKDLSKKVPLTLPCRWLQSAYVNLRLESSLDGKDLNRMLELEIQIDNLAGWSAPPTPPKYTWI